MEAEDTPRRGAGTAPARGQTDATLALGGIKVRQRIAVLRARLERLLLWRVWERMLEIEFVDRSVALAGKAFVSFFPLVIVVAAFVPERIRSSIITTVTARLGMRGDALTLAREAFASSDDVRRATGLLGLVLTIFFASSFTTALQRVYLRAWRRPARAGTGGQWRGPAWLFVVLVCMAFLGGLRGARRRRARTRPLRHRVPGRDLRAVVVHRLVPPARRRAPHGCCSHRR